MPRKRFDETKYRGGISGLIFPASIGRAEFVARNIGLSILISLPLALLGGITEQSESGILLLIYMLLAFMFFLFGLWFSIIPRITDVGWSKKLAWLTIIPVVGQIFGLALLITPGK